MSLAAEVRPSRLRPTRRGSTAVALVGAGALVGIVLSGCSSSSVAPSGSAGSSSATAPSDFDGVTVTGDFGAAPMILIGDSTQQTSSLQYKDLVVGSGPAATASDPVTVQYVAKSAKTKRQFDSSWDRGKPFSYDPAKIAFKAFTEGVPGMKVGGRRVVIVPGSLAYGASPPSWSGLGPNETLVFVIDLMSIDSR